MAQTYQSGEALAKSAEVTSVGWWKEAAGRLLARINEHRVMLIAAGVTYYLVLAMVPALSLLVSLYGLFNDPSTVNQHIGMLSGIVPGGALSIVGEQLTRLTSTPRGTLSLTLVGSLLIALWSSSSGIKALFDAMNVAHEREEHRNFFVLNGLALLFTLCGIIAAVVAIGAVVVIPAVVNLFFRGWGLDWLVTLAGYAVMLVVLVGGIAALYRWGPSQYHGRWKLFSPGTVLTVCATIVVSVLFSWYAANFGNYNAAYGSLGALVGMLTWLWLSMTVLIVGAELNAEIEVGSVTKQPAAAAAPSLPSRGRRPDLVSLMVVLPAALLLAWAGRRRER